MPKFFVGPDATGDVRTLLDLLDPSGLDPEPVVKNATTLQYSRFSLSVTIYGKGFAYGPGDVPSSGTVHRIVVTIDGDIQYRITKLDLPLTQVWKAFTADLGDGDPDALESLFLPLGYTYTGSKAADILRPGTESGDHVPLNLKGDDSFKLRGGDDVFWLGSGDDHGYGGAGHDELYGGRGADKLFGGKGIDLLYGGDGTDSIEGGAGDDLLSGGQGKDVLKGGADNDRLESGLGDDTLYGGGGKDKLFGGAGRDTLFGGAGNDTLTGGGGDDTDRFIFYTGDGKDRIADFDIGVDLVVLRTDRAVSFEDAGDDVRVRYGSSAVLLLDTDFADLTASEWLIIQP